MKSLIFSAYLWLEGSVIQTSVIIINRSNIVIITIVSISTVHAISISISILLPFRSNHSENNREQEEAVEQTKHHGQHKHLDMSG